MRQPPSQPAKKAAPPKLVRSWGLAGAPLHHLGSGGRAVRLPEHRAIAGGEEERVSDGGQAGGGEDRLDHRGPGARAIGFQEPTPHGEEERARDVRQMARRRGGAQSGDRVFDERCAREGPIRLPQRPPVVGVIGQEEERVADPGEVCQMGLVMEREVGVLDELGPGGAPVRFPQRLAVARVVGAEEELTTDARQVRGFRRLGRVLRARCPGPELQTPGQTSLTSWVPAAVPLDLQSSDPWFASVAAKKTFAWNGVMFSGVESALPGLMSLTRLAVGAAPTGTAIAPSAMSAPVKIAVRTVLGIKCPPSRSTLS